MRSISKPLSIAALAAGALLLAVPALAQDPCDLNPDLPICSSSEDPSPEPTTEPSPEPSPTPTSAPSPEPSPQPEPSVAPSQEPTEGETFTPFEGSVTPPTFNTGDAPTTGGGTTTGGQAPQVFDPNQPGGGTTGGSGSVPIVLVGVDDLAAALPGTFGIGLLTALLGAGAAVGTRGLLRRGGFVSRTADGGTDVERTSRTRTMIGVALLGAAALAGIVGYLKISLEPIVAVQVVYLASAGFAVVVLAIAGGSLIVSDQLRADEHRIGQLESALGSVAEHLRPAVQEPPRLLDRSTPEPPAKPARKRAAKKT